MRSEVHFVAVVGRVVQALDEALDLLRVLALEVQRQGEVVVRLVGLAQLLVDLAQQHGNRRLLGHQALQRLELLHRLVVLLQLDQGVGLLVLIQAVLGVQALGLLEVLEGLLELAVGCQRHAHEGVEHWVFVVDSEGLVEVFAGLVVLLLLVADVAEAPPGAVVAHVVVEGLLEGALGLGEVLVIDVLVAAERIGIWVLRVELDGPGEEFKGLLVLLLQGEAVADGDPGFGRVDGLLEGLVGQEAEVDLLLQVPQAAGVVLNSLYPVRLDLVGLLIVLRCLVVLDDFHVGPSDGGEHPAGVEVILRQFLEVLHRLQAVVSAEVVVPIGELLEQGHETLISDRILEDSEEWMLFLRLGSWLCGTFFAFSSSSFRFLETGVETMVFLKLVSKFFILASLKILFGMMFSPSLPSFS